VVVVLHHRIAADGERRGLISATAADLDRQIALLARSCEVITPADVSLELLAESGRHVIVTFDDCYVDNYEVALPILVREGVPATFFVASGFLDGTAKPWWDEIEWIVRSSHRARLDPSDWWSEPLGLGDDDAPETITRIVMSYRRCTPERGGDLLEHLARATGSGRQPAESVAREFMSWQMVREARAAGVGIGAHTATHPVMTTLSEEAQRAEVETSVGRIQTELGEAPGTFAYPVGVRGTFDQTTKRVVSAAGISKAFSNYGGYTAAKNWDPLDIRRIPLGLSTSPAAFRWIVSVPQVFAAR
jgi:peptidoglycan/xylan/chitin deacetylase (PgdA/CDA1 family)